MSLAFLSPGGGSAHALAESPLADATADVGATYEARDGWRVAVRIGDARREALARMETVAWADFSHLGKLEIQTSADAAESLASLAGGLTTGTAVRHGDAWWCLVTPVRALVVCEAPATAEVHRELASRDGFDVLDVTTQFAALRIAGPAARETFARFCALDLRADKTPVGAFVPGSIARTPGFVIREAEDQYLTLTGAAYALSYWEVVSDAGGSLGGRSVGIDALSASVTGEKDSTHA